MKFGTDHFTNEQREILKKLDGIATRLESGNTTKNIYFVQKIQTMIENHVLWQTYGSMITMNRDCVTLLKK
jgi:hypothetical protein